MDSFYVVLPSNTPVEGNTTSKFTVRLPETLELDSNWTVALSSIIYPHSFATIGEKELQYIDVYFDEGKIRVPIASLALGITFKSVTELGETLNEAMNNFFRLKLEKQGSGPIPIETSSRFKRAIELKEEGELKVPEKVEESPEIIAAVEEFKKKKEQGKFGKAEEKTQTLSVTDKSGQIEEKPKESISETPKTSTDTLEEASNRIEEEKKLLSAKRAIERAWQQCVTLATQIENLADLARAKRQKSELQRRRFPSVGQELYNQLSTIAHTIQDRAILIGDEAKIAANAKNKIVVFMKAKNVAEARKMADIAKKAEQNARSFGNEASRLFAGTPDKNYQDGVEQLAIRIKFLINSVAGPSEEPDEAVTEAAEPSLPEPQYPPDHSKLQEKSDGDKKIDNTLKTPEKIEETPEIIAAVEEFKKRKGQAIDKKKDEIKQLEKIEETPEIIEAVEKKKQQDKDEKVSNAKDIVIMRENEIDRELVLKPSVIREKDKSSDKQKEVILLREGEFKDIKLEKEPTQKAVITKDTIIPKRISEDIVEDKVLEPIHIRDSPKIQKQHVVENILRTDTDTDIRILPSMRNDKKPSEIISQKVLTIDDVIREEDLPDLPEPMALKIKLTSKEIDESLKNKIKIKGDYKKVKFVFDKITQRFYPIFANEVHYIVVSKELAYVLGYTTQRINRQQLADYLPDITGGVKQLFVYAPKLVENTILGNVSAPLLRVVNIKGEPGQIQESIYTGEYHQRLQLRHIPEINIEIRTANGDLVEFNWGNIIITLHFKRSFF